jgi:type VI protein secretion system component VasK
MSRMQKTETVDLPAPRSLKEELEEAARSRHTSVADLLEQIVREWLERARGKGKDTSETEEDDEERQQRLRAELMKLAGSIEGDDPHRAENARYLVQERLARKYGR